MSALRRIRATLAAILILAAGSFARGQTANTNIYYSNIAWASSYVSGQQVLVPIPNAQITVCNYPAVAVPCTNLATLYYGPTVGGGVSTTNPVSTDQYGNFGFWAATGFYQYTVTNTLGQSAGPYTFVLGGPQGTAGTFASLGQNSPNNWAGICTMTSGTTCTITISASYTTPICISTGQFTGTVIASTCAVSGSTVTITAASTNSNTWAAAIFGDPR